MSSGSFKLTDKYSPKGDQPKAIESLADGLRAGDRFQTLLGVTGSGKSVAGDEPVTVHLGSDRYYRGPIGQLIDSVIGTEQFAETVECMPPEEWRVLAWDAGTGQTEWRRITALSRHESPERLFRLTTACGRRVTVTGDHSLWVLRDGHLCLTLGTDLRTGDAVPIPANVPRPAQPLRYLNLLELLRESPAGISVDLRSSRADRALLRTALAPFYPNLGEKLWAIRRSVKGHGVRIGVATALLGSQVVSSSELRIQGKRHSVPACLEMTEELATIFGQYVAEGHAADRFVQLSVREPEVQRELARCLQSRDVPFFRRPDGDFVSGSRVWRDLLHRLMGSTAGKKRLPEFWPALSDHHLAALLRGYFEGDGGVEHDAVVAVTLSPELAADLAEALLRFGIWARLCLVHKRAPGGVMGTYTRITISGASNLRRYAEWIGFISTRKRDALGAYLRNDDGNTSVDLIPGVGPRLLGARQQLGLSQLDIARRAECTRSMISLIESGLRQPSRSLFLRLCEALEIQDPQFLGLANMHWSRIDSIEDAPAVGPFVYDFSVDGFETFLTGRGGLFVHNTFSMAGVIEKVQRPTLVIAHNKTLAAQLCSEFREFFPENAVEYFVSYYDYYQPEAYIPQTDTYIEKDSSINDEIDRLRHSSTQAVLERRDVIVVASVSCIYGLGSPEEYQTTVLSLQAGGSYRRRDLLEQLVSMQFTRNDVAPVRGTFRVKGDVLEIFPADEEVLLRCDFFGDELEEVAAVDPTTGEILSRLERVTVFPASHFVASEERLERAIKEILVELDERLEVFRSRGQLLEAQRLEQRTRYDVEMMREVGYCNGIENYSRHLDGRAPGTPPHTLIDYFPKDFLLLIDESHVTIPQLHGMYSGDMSRKETLVEYGFRLPSAKDNRPLRWEEFEKKVGQAIFVSATPGPFEREVSAQIVEQIIRPTGLLDPEIEVRKTMGQIDDLIGEIRKRVAVGERVLVTTLTKKMAEDLSEYLANIDIKVNYLHSDIKTLDRSEILRDLRLGVYDVIVGINLLREGLDLPEVSLVAILDADKEGFLRSETSLIQTIGRAARHVRGKVLLYADTMTGSMERAITETNRRRQIQMTFNEEHGIIPQSVEKAIRDTIHADGVRESRARYDAGAPDASREFLPIEDMQATIQALEVEMKKASKALEFERAAEIRDEIARLKKLIPDDHSPVSIAQRPRTARR
jgi:excinuclease ABC B subunit